MDTARSRIRPHVLDPQPDPATQGVPVEGDAETVESLRQETGNLRLALLEAPTYFVFAFFDPAMSRLVGIIYVEHSGLERLRALPLSRT